MVLEVRLRWAFLFPACRFRAPNRYRYWNRISVRLFNGPLCSCGNLIYLKMNIRKLDFALTDYLGLKLSITAVDSRIWRRWCRLLCSRMETLTIALLRTHLDTRSYLYQLEVVSQSWSREVGSTWCTGSFRIMDSCALLVCFFWIHSGTVPY